MVFSRDLRPANLDKGQEACRLRLYQLYAWGVPFGIATLAAVLDRIPPDQYVSLIRPKFGEHRCWFYGKYRSFMGWRTRRLPGYRCNFMHVFKGNVCDISTCISGICTRRVSAFYLCICLRFSTKNLNRKENCLT